MDEQVHADPADEEVRKRRLRTDTYVSLWAVSPVPPELAPPTLCEAMTSVRLAHDVHARLLVEALLGLVGQGLGKREVFAVADAHDLWAAFTRAEHDAVLGDDMRAEDLQTAELRFEAAAALEWALGLLRHLPFADELADPGQVVRLAFEEVGARPAEQRSALRPVKELLDRADIERRVAASAGAHQRIAAERARSLSWLVGAAV